MCLFFRAGYLSYNTAFGFLDYLPGGESKGGVWRLIDAHFQYIFKRLWREQEYRLMKSYTKSLQTVFRQVWEKEQPDNSVEIQTRKGL